MPKEDERAAEAAIEAAMVELAKATEQYETYLELSQLTEFSGAAETTWAHDPKAPLTLSLKV